MRPSEIHQRPSEIHQLPTAHGLVMASCLKRAGEYKLATDAYRKLGKHVQIARMLAAAAEKTHVRREAVELLAASAKAWEDAGRLTQAMLVRLSHKELQQSGFEMLNKSFPERDRLRHVALPHLEARKLCVRRRAELRDETHEAARSMASSLLFSVCLIC